MLCSVRRPPSVSFFVRGADTLSAARLAKILSMLRRSLLSLTPLAFFRAGAAPPCPSYFAKGLQARWNASREYTLAVLDKMPDEHLTFRPTPEEWTFSQQLTHIADGSLLIAAPLHGDKPVYSGAPPRQLARAELKK